MTLFVAKTVFFCLSKRLNAFKRRLQKYQMWKEEEGEEEEVEKAVKDCKSIHFNTRNISVSCILILNIILLTCFSFCVTKMVNKSTGVGTKERVVERDKKSNCERCISVSVKRTEPGKESRFPHERVGRCCCCWISRREREKEKMKRPKREE